LKPEGWQNGYCTSLENWRPQGLGGSNPSPSVTAERRYRVWYLAPGTWYRPWSYCPSADFGAGASRASLAFMVLNPESLTCRLLSCDAGT
jgi:hypothetical protein